MVEVEWRRCEHSREDRVEVGCYVYWMAQECPIEKGLGRVKGTCALSGRRGREHHKYEEQHRPAQLEGSN